MTAGERAERRLSAFEAVLDPDRWAPDGSRTYHVGVDLGTATIVTAVVDDAGTPAAGVLTRSGSSIRDGLVLDYVGAVAVVQRHVQALKIAGFSFTHGAAAYPPGTTGRNAQAFANVLTAADLEVAGLVDEPSAAALTLDIKDGAVVDIGGGTTGISVLEGGRVVYTADEPTGGVHVDLVLAGRFKIDLDEAERWKTDPRRQRELFPVVRPVFQKMAAIVRDHLRAFPGCAIYLAGGTSAFPGLETVMAEETERDVIRPRSPLLVTPLGIALSGAGMRETAGLSDDRTERRKR